MAKSHRGAGEAGRREAAVLRRLSPLLPVPAPISDKGADVLLLPFIDGVNGRELDGAALGPMCEQLGAFLRALQDVDADSIRDILPGDGEVIVHGDFAPYNAVFDDSIGLVAVLDWETAHLGSRLTDIAWCEYQVEALNHHWAVGHLFSGYGETPDPLERELAVAARLAALRPKRSRPPS